MWKLAAKGKKEKCYSVEDIESIIITNKYIIKTINVMLLARLNLTLWQKSDLYITLSDVLTRPDVSTSK